MAEIGLGLSIISIFHSAAHATDLGIKYVNDVKNAPASVRELIDQLRSFSSVLSSIRDISANDTKSVALARINDPNGGVYGCLNEMDRELEKLETIFRKLTDTPTETKSRSIQSFSKRLKRLFQSMTWPLDEADTKKLISRLVIYQDHFTVALSLDQSSQLQSVGSKVEDIHESIVDDKKVRVLEWIFPDSFDSKHIHISGERLPNTGYWLLETPEFKEFFGGTGQMLWGHGIPGAGKTFLSSFVIDYARSQGRHFGYGVAFVYFDYQERNQQTPYLVLKNILMQLVNQIDHLPSVIENFYDNLIRERRSPTEEELFTILASTFEFFSKVFMVFDALDECHDISKLLPTFHRMRSAGASLFLTSRPYPEQISVSLSSVQKITISARSGDVEAFVLDRMKKASDRVQRFIDKAGKRKVVHAITSSCEGMFLLAHLHFEYLSKQAMLKYFLQALTNIKSSSDLKATYDRCMEILQNNPRETVQLAMKVLAWLAKARRPLTVDELCIAASIEPDSHNISSMDTLDGITLHDICAGFADVDERTHTVRIVHYTAQEYLLKHHMEEKRVELQLAKCCIIYLSFDVFAQGACLTGQDLEARIKSHQFLDYAARNVSSHVTSSNDQMTVEQFLEFEKRSASISSYQQIFHSEKGAEAWSYNKYPKPSLRLHAASEIGHCTAVGRLLSSGEDIAERNENGETALHFAAGGGHERVAHLLVEEGIDVSAQDSDGETALHHASECGYLQLVQYLLDNNANPLIRSKTGDTPLHRGAEHGSLPIVELLLEKGANTTIQTQGTDGKTALFRAAECGHQAIVRLLLERGAEASIQAEDGRTAFHRSAERGDITMTELLLKHGKVDVSARGKNGKTAMYRAAESGDVPVVQLLIDNGADVDIADDYGETPLIRAAEHGDEPVVRLILKHTSNPSHQHQGKESALHRAAERGSEGVVRLLLDHHADLSLRDDLGRTPLFAAVQGASAPVVRMLLDSGADITVQDVFRQTVLNRAMDREKVEVITLLEERGASLTEGGSVHDAMAAWLYKIDPLARGSFGRTALYRAAECGDSKVVRLLLDRGADPSAPDDYKETALHRAAEAGDEIIAQMLLESGADPQLRDGDGETPLHRAAERGSYLVARMLLDYGAKPSIEDDNGNTPLYRATRSKANSVIRLLVERGADAEEHGDKRVHYIRDRFLVGQTIVGESKASGD